MHRLICIAGLVAGLVAGCIHSSVDSFMKVLMSKCETMQDFCHVHFVAFAN